MKYKVLASIIALLVFSFQMYAQNMGNIVDKKSANQGKNYSIIPKLPPPPKPEPFEVSTIPLPKNVSDAVLVNYLPDGKHLIMEVTMAGSKKSDLAVMLDDGSGFKCLTCGLKEEIGG